MKNSYPRNFINKVLTKIRNKQRINKSNEQPTEQSKRMVTLPYINGTSEMTARILRPFNIDVAHKPLHKLRSYFTKHKDKTAITETNNAIYMIPCGDCSQRYILYYRVSLTGSISPMKLLLIYVGFISS